MILGYLCKVILYVYICWRFNVTLYRGGSAKLALEHVQSDVHTHMEILKLMFTLAEIEHFRKRYRVKGISGQKLAAESACANSG